MTDEEKLAMYMKITKANLAIILLEANKHLKYLNNKVTASSEVDSPVEKETMKNDDTLYKLKDSFKKYLSESNKHILNMTLTLNQWAAYGFTIEALEKAYKRTILSKNFNYKEIVKSNEDSFTLHEIKLIERAVNGESFGILNIRSFVEFLLSEGQLHESDKYRGFDFLYNVWMGKNTDGLL